MVSRIRHVTVDCHNPYELARFWSAVTGLPVEEGSHPGDDEVALLPADPTGSLLLFIQVPESKTVKNRLHLDLQPDQPRDQEVERVLALGAALVDDRRNPDGTGWVVLADPEGNEFCVERSAAERQSAGSP